MNTNQRWIATVLALAGPLMVLGIWEALARSGVVNPLFYPPPTSLIETARELARERLWDDLRASLTRVGAGFIIAAVPGVLLGTLMGVWWPLRALLSPVASAAFAIPKIAILPLVIIIFGIGESSKIAMVAISVFFLVVLSTMSAVLEVDRAYFDVARNAGANFFEQMRTVAIPGALPGIFTGLRLALGFSLLVIVGTEFLASRNGIGHLIWNSWQTFAIEKMYVGLVVTGILGWLLNLIMDEIERVFMPWKAPSSRGAMIPVPQVVRDWYMATRPFSFTASVIPVLVGTFLAAQQEGNFKWPLFGMVMLASVMVHAASNLVNDYFDWRNGADKPAALGRGGAIQRGIIKPRGIFWFGIVLFVVATALGLVIVWMVGWQVLLFALPSLAAAYFYTGGPKPLGYVALGEATVFIFMGPMIVLGSYFVQTEQITWTAFLISVPVGLMVTAILQANNIRDIADDLEANKRTVATFIGRRWANLEFILLIAGAYAVTLVVALGGVTSAGLLIVFITLPRAITVIRTVLQRDEARALNYALRQTAGLHLQFGLLVSAVLLISAWTA